MTSYPRQPLGPSQLSSSSSSSSGTAMRMSNPSIETGPTNFKAQFLEMLKNRIYKKHSNNSACLPHIGKHEVKMSTGEEETKIRSWIELPLEIWLNIFSNMKTMEIIKNVQKVCKLFHKICKEPNLFDTIDMSTPVEYGITKIPVDIHTLTRQAIHLSAGRTTDIYIEYVCEEKTLEYIGQRCKRLKKLRLGHFLSFPDELSESLIETIKRLPSLEEVQLKNCLVSDDVIEGIGHACPSLTSLDLTKFFDDPLNYFGGQEGFSIPNSMPNLRRLTLTNTGMDNTDLEAILDGCPNLEYLDLRGCQCMKLSGDLGKRCERIKHVRHPQESIEDVVAEYEVWHQHRIVEYPDMKPWHERASQCT